jgi:hypothetical protein
MLKDWLKTILILFLCFFCLALIEMGGQIKNLQENWGAYRCNPAIIPIAGYIAPAGNTMSTSDNMSYCIQSMMATFAPTVLQPLTYLQGKTTSMVGNLTDSMYAAREQQQQAQQKSSSSFGSIYSIFANVIVTFNVIIIKLIAAQGKSSAIMATLMHVLATTKVTFESMWNGVPGKMIQMLGS